MLCISLVNTLLNFFAVGFALQCADLYADFGFVNERPTLIGLLLANFIFSPVNAIVSFLFNALTRKFEFEAVCVFSKKKC